MGAAACASPLYEAAPGPEEPQAETAWLKDRSRLRSGNAFTVEVTAYCPCRICCGKDDGITGTGRPARANRTIAVDPSVIPLGSQVYLEGLGAYVAEDVGGAIKGRKIDLFMDEHHQALQFGVKFTKVHLLQEAI